MSILPIKIYGSEVLRRKAEAIENITDDIHDLIKGMRDSLYYHQGIGLAANQVGVAKRLFVIDESQGRDLRIFINPRIIEEVGTVTAEEGCLSLPEIYVEVLRSRSLLLEYIDDRGGSRRLEAEGLLARVIQHECDHLNGVMTVDHAGFLARRMIKGKLKKLEKRVQETF